MPSHKGHKGNIDADNSRASHTLLNGYLSPCHIVGSACRRGKRATIVPLDRISNTGNRSARTLYLAFDDLKTSEAGEERKKAGQ